MSPPPPLPDPLRANLDQRYLAWRLTDARREVDEGFPLVGAVQGSVAVRLVEVTRDWPTGDRHLLLAALIKSAPYAGSAARLPLAPAEASRLDAYAARRQPGFGAEDQEARRRQVATAMGLKLDRRRLLAEVKRALEPLLGRAEAVAGNSVWRWVSTVRGFRVHTEVDVGGRLHQLSYGHDLFWAGGAETSAGAASSPSARDPGGSLVARVVSLLSWLGVTSQTDWTYLRDPDIPAAAATVHRCCAHFLAALPGWLPDAAC